jgi:hypothetical protein
VIVTRHREPEHAHAAIDIRTAIVDRDLRAQTAEVRPIGMSIECVLIVEPVGGGAQIA